MLSNNIHLQKENMTLTDENPEKSSLYTNTIFENSPGCTVLRSGLVNCSTDVYHDRKTWRRSRNKIDDEIHQLRQKLEDLKEIRRHLKQKRPIPGSEEDISDDFEMKQQSTSTESSDNLQFNNLNNFDYKVMLNQTDGTSTTESNTSESTTPRGRNKQRNSNEDKRKSTRVPETQTQSNNRTVLRRKHKYSNTTEYGSSTNSDLFFNTTSRPLTFTNHHRHYHHRYHSPSTTESIPNWSQFDSNSTSETYTESSRSTSRMTEAPNRIQYRVSLLYQRYSK